MPLADLFPTEDYRFRMSLRPGDPAEFFRPQDASGRLLAERARWIAENPARYAALQPAGAALLAEAAERLETWTGARGISGDIRALGTAVEPDVLLLASDGAGEFRLRGGALCFPTGWALEEKLGHPLDFIHGVVPGLNAALGAPIGRFLEKLRSDGAFFRHNWGLAATPELNLHPARALPPLVAPLALERVWLRVEHQALVALPRAGGVLFGIRIALHRLDELRREPAAAAGLARALRSMPEPVAVYKRLAPVRADLLALLG